MDTLLFSTGHDSQMHQVVPDSHERNVMLREGSGGRLRSRDGNRCQGTDPDMAAVNVQNRVSMAQGLLPAEVTRIGVTTQKRQTSMLVVFLSLIHI